MKTSEIKLLTIVLVFLLAVVVDSGFLGMSETIIVLGVVGSIAVIGWLYILLKSVKKPNIVFKSSEAEISVSRAV